MKRARGKCEKKGCDREATQVHHLTYTRLGHEELTDLQALCFPCHRNCHPDKEFPPPDPVDARDFDCSFCPSERGDLYIGDAKLHFICNRCGGSKVEDRGWLKAKKYQQKKRKEKRKRLYKEDDRRFCDICYKELANPYGAKQHKRDVHGISFKEQSKENKSHLSRRELQKRMKKGKEKEKYTQCVCPFCDKTFGSSFAMRQHCKDKHESSWKQTVGCSQKGCNRKFKTQAQMQQHWGAVHSKKANPYKCVCGKQFSSYVELREHQRSGHL